MVSQKFLSKHEVMSRLSPAGPVYQAGTLSGNPVAVAAGLATLKHLNHSIYDGLEKVASEIETRLAQAVAERGCSMTRVGSMFTIFFRAEIPHNFMEVSECDMAAFGRYHRAALSRGVYLPPSQYEAAFLPAGLGEKELDLLVSSIEASLAVA